MLRIRELLIDHEADIEASTKNSLETIPEPWGKVTEALRAGKYATFARVRQVYNLVIRRAAIAYSAASWYNLN
jgi:hypothetical protein